MNSIWVLYSPKLERSSNDMLRYSFGDPGSPLIQTITTDNLVRKMIKPIMRSEPANGDYTPFCIRGKGEISEDPSKLGCAKLSTMISIELVDSSVELEDSDSAIFIEKDEVLFGRWMLLQDLRIEEVHRSAWTNLSLVCLSHCRFSL